MAPAASVVSVSHPVLPVLNSRKCCAKLQHCLAHAMNVKALLALLKICIELVLEF